MDFIVGILILFFSIALIFGIAVVFIPSLVALGDWMRWKIEVALGLRER